MTWVTWTCVVLILLYGGLALAGVVLEFKKERNVRAEDYLTQGED